MTRHDLIAVVAAPGMPAWPKELAAMGHQGLWAVHRNIPAPRMRLPESRKARLRGAAEHQRLLEALMPYGTVMPVAQGTALARSELTPFLRANAARLLKVAAPLEGQVQFQVSVLWDAPRVLDRFRHAPELAPLFAAAPVSPAALGAAVTSLARRLGREMADGLTSVASEALELPLGEDMLCNLALLVPSREAALVDLAVERIDALWTEGLKIRQIGPAPAGSFATLRLDWQSPAQVRKAHDLFGLLPGDGQDLKPLRKRLMTDGTHPADTIRAAEACIHAIRAAGDVRGVHLARLWREGEGQAQLTLAEVA